MDARGDDDDEDFRRTIVVIKEHALQYFYFRFERRDVATKDANVLRIICCYKCY